MKIALLYPPPWKIPMPGEAPDPEHGPPGDYQPGDLDPDFHQIPYGLLTLGAESMRAGHRVQVMNLSGFAWSRVREVIAALDANVFGMSCWTANRRGVALVAELIKELHPGAHVIVGGPHATPLAREMLEHHAAIDSVAQGESEATFLELVSRLGQEQPVTGLAGALTRHADGSIVEGPERASIQNLDELASPHDYFPTHIVMTSRGCPWQCTFCGAETSWGRGFRAHSIEYVLDDLERALDKLPVRMIQIKDDTFTTNKKRVIDLCRGMRARGLRFAWSCDTRVDVLNEELLREMRLAGCERLSLGVESGSQRILDAIQKKITVNDIVEATEMAKKYGVQVRFYMMLGNRGDTAETFRETLDFLERAKPHQYIFSCLSIYPGTTDFHDAEKAGWLAREVYFSGDFQEFKVPFDAPEADAALMNDWFAEHSGVREMYTPSVEDCRAVVGRLGDHPPALLDLAKALYDAGQLDDAERTALRAQELGHPLPGLVLNLRACIAHARGNLEAMKDHFMTAAKTDPQHWVLIDNVQRTRAWFAAQGPERGVPLALDASHGFRLFEKNLQPMLPGPLPEGWQEWPAPPEPPPRRAQDQDRTRLKVLSSP
ncbi:MAG: radical SAM protein [Myxococcales bacterium]|nr:radical SAM protein [Myxococcales bacterium]MCB9576061.1 radical SAM protein [Polyangiaceae bacterium]